MRQKVFFLATLVALDFTPVSKWDKGVKWDEIFKAPILWVKQKYMKHL